MVMTGSATEAGGRRVDCYGTVVKHVGECRTCGRTVVDDGTVDGLDRVDDELAGHIDDGTPCHDYRINAIYADGGERRV